MFVRAPAAQSRLRPAHERSRLLTLGDLMPSVLDNIAIIDADSHVQEPPDLWTSRVAWNMQDKVPQLRWDDDDQAEVWFLGRTKMLTPGFLAAAGWNEYPPLGPRRFADIHPSMWDSQARLTKLDQLGIHAQILYPNLATFASRQFTSDVDRDIHTLCIQVYNNFLSEWTSAAPDRLLAIAAIPFWDLELAVRELTRCKEMGHRGMMFTQDPSAFGLPHLANRHWDPLWAAAQEMGMPVNFHIGSGDNGESIYAKLDASMGVHAMHGSISMRSFLENAHTISQLIFGGVCHRFPNLNFVSVESGVGWLPFVVEGMDWQWLSCGVHLEHPEYDLLPSEYFRRQIYGSFWFERDTALYAIDKFADNIFYETDFPHPTSMSPGPASPAVEPLTYIEGALATLAPSTLHKILHDNAARVYHLDG